MKPSTRFSSFALFLLGLGTASQAQVHLPFSRQHGNLNEITRRDANPAQSLSATDYLYIVNVTLGTPGQDVALVISPSSADTWVPSTSSCQYRTSNDEYYDEDTGRWRYNTSTTDVCYWGGYNTSASSTYRAANEQYQDWYTSQPDGTYVSGTNITDTLQLGIVKLENYPFAVAESSMQHVGVLGLGANLSSTSYSSSGNYDNLPDLLVKQNVINSKAYSIWLDDEQGASGSLLLGAVDTSRFEGTLMRLDSYGTVAGAFGVIVASINMTSPTDGTTRSLDGGNDFPFRANIGHGETFSNVPDATAQEIWSLAGATYDNMVGLATIPCDTVTGDGGNMALFNIQLAGDDGPILDVRLADLIIPPAVSFPFVQAVSYGNDVPASSDTCLFAVQNGSTWGYTSYSYSNLGAALLRRSYMVFDVVNDEVAIAPVRFGVTDPSNIVAFASYGAFTPEATSYAGSSSGSGSGSDPGSGDSDTGGSGYSPGAYGPSSDGSSYASNRNAVIIGCSVGFGLLTLASLLVAFAIWKKLICGPRVKTGKDIDDEGGEQDDSGPPPHQVPAVPGPAASATTVPLGSRAT